MLRVLRNVISPLWTSVRTINISISQANDRADVQFHDFDNNAIHAVLSSFEISDEDITRGPRLYFSVGKNWPYQVKYSRGHVYDEITPHPADHVVLAKCAIESVLSTLFVENLIQNRSLSFHVFTMNNNRRCNPSSHNIQIAYEIDEQHDHRNKKAQIASVSYHEDQNTIVVEFQPMSTQLLADIRTKLAEIVINDKTLIDNTVKQRLIEFVISL